MTDIDRQKLRELCERATPGPWTVDETNADDVQSPTRFAGPVVVYADDDCDVHPVADCSCNHTCRDDEAQRDNAAFIAAARTALPALLDLTDAQAAKTAELEAENASLRERADAPEDRTWFWEIVDRDGLANVGSDERQALADLCRAAAERDQLRKQGEGLRWEPISTAPETGEDLELLLQDGEISEARWNNERYCMLGSRAGSFPPGWSPTRSSGVDLNLPMTFDGNEPTHWRLAAASALEQKEQG